VGRGPAARLAGDWLLVVGDVAEKVADIEWTLRTLRGRFGTVVWVPGHHDLWSYLHIPRTTWQDGVRFAEVSLGYPHEQDKYPNRPRQLTQIMPFEPSAGT
jgi:3',5'-cyclic AMP phosphodiesterase CpdA